MGVSYNPKILTDGIVFATDVGNLKSYSSGQLNDMAASRYAGVLNNNPVYDSSVLGNLSFNGVNNYVSYASTSGSVFTFTDTTFTVSAWVKTTDTPVDPTFIVAKDMGSTNNGWGIGMGVPGIPVGSTSYGFFVFNKGPPTGGVVIRKSTTVSINDGQWHNVVAVITTDTVNVPGTNDALMYIDGENKSVVSQTPIVKYGAPTLQMEIGRRAAGNYFNGNIANISIYNRALTAAEIQQNFNALRGRFGI